ncbi:MAG: hypothetical protein OSB26_11330 [Woeseiaceae bacterium]|nr:hypothetical protein [Woeseiaceae bacterium]
MFPHPRQQLLYPGHAPWRLPRVRCVNGSVDVDFNGDVSAEINIETFNGSIRNCFSPDAVKMSKYAPGRELDFTEGSGNGRVKIRTLNGSVRLCK